MIVDKYKHGLDNFFLYWYEKTCGIWLTSKEEKEVKTNLTGGSINNN